MIKEHTLILERLYEHLSGGWIGSLEFLHNLIFKFVFYLEKLQKLGYSIEEIEKSLMQKKYDKIFATYMLMQDDMVSEF